MKHLFVRRATTAFILSSFLQIGVAAEPAPGVIEFLADDKPVCTLKIEEGKVNLFKKEQGCNGGWQKKPTIKLINARSGAYITLSAFRGAITGQPDHGCHNSGNFEVVLKTIKDKPELPSLNIYDLQRYDAGKSVFPGLLLISKNFPHPEFVTGVNCLRIDFR
jgi:hypothetical protein